MSPPLCTEGRHNNVSTYNGAHILPRAAHGTLHHILALVIGSVNSCYCTI